MSDDNIDSSTLDVTNANLASNINSTSTKVKKGGGSFLSSLFGYNRRRTTNNKHTSKKSKKMKGKKMKSKKRVKK